jgi:hypothetical protein
MELRDRLKRRPRPTLVVRGRRYRSATVVSGGVQLHRTVGQWAFDQCEAIWCRIKLVWSILFWATLIGCGGAPFELAEGVDAGDGAPIEMQPEDSAPDARLGFRPDAGGRDSTPPDAEPDATPAEASPPEASTEAAPSDAEPPDACAAPAWDCRGSKVTAHNFCVTYLGADGGLVGVEAEGNAAVGCPACGGGCACLSMKSICGYWGSGPLARYAGCVERVPGEPEVTCQE